MNEGTPLVSVVIPCYNHEDFVQDAIQSVIDQSYDNIELIIIDDGSKDSSVEKIEQMVSQCENRFTRFEFRHRPNKGLSNTLNEAIEWCQGKYFAGLASDDVILEHKTKVQVNYLERHPDIVAVFGGVNLVDDNDALLSEKLRPAKRYEQEDIMMHKFHLPAATQMIRLETIKKVGGYDPTIKLEDWYMWIKLSQAGGIYYMNQVLALYRQHDTNFSKNKAEMWQGRVEVINRFKDSPYYKEAMKKVVWLNARAVYKNSEGNKVKNFGKLFLTRPLKALNMVLINDPIKKLRGKE